MFGSFLILNTYKQFLLHYLGERINIKLEYTALKPQNNILVYCETSI